MLITDPAATVDAFDFSDMDDVGPEPRPAFDPQFDFWAAVFGDRTPGDVVSEFGLAGSDDEAITAFVAESVEEAQAQGATFGADLDDLAAWAVATLVAADGWTTIVWAPAALDE